MTPADLRAARQTLGLSAAKLAVVLRLGACGARTVRRWEAGDSSIPGPVEVALELLLERHQAQIKRHLARVKRLRARTHPITPILLASAT